MLPGALVGDPTFGDPPHPAGARDAGLQPGGLRGGLDAPSAGSHDSTVSLWCESGVHSEQGPPGPVAAGGRGWGAPLLANTPTGPPPPQVLPACAGPRAAAVGADAPRGAPAGPGALTRRVLRNGPGADQVGWAAAQGVGAQSWPHVLTAPRAPTSAAACSPSSSAAITAPTSPSMTASSRSSPRARRPRKRCPRPLPRPAPRPPQPCLLPSLFLSLSLSRPNVVLGVTNPFFIKTLQHWPHILRVGEPKTSGEAVPASTQGPWGHAWGLVGSEPAETELRP